MAVNNANVAGMINVPEDIADWPFMHLLFNCTATFGATSEDKLNMQICRRTLLKQLSLMSNT